VGAIEYLRFTTSRGNFLEVGSDKNHLRCKRFDFDIRKSEKVISFSGTLDVYNHKKDPEK